MPERRKTVQDSSGATKEGLVVDIQKITASPTIVDLADGTRITLQITLNEAIRIVDEWGPDGSPQYNVEVGATMKIDAPPALRKPEDENADES